MRRILVTGGAGFIGSHLTEFFISQGDTVWSVDNFITGSRDNIKPFLQDKKFQFIEADVTDGDYLKKLQDQRFDLIYHLASPASPKQYIRYPIETLLVNAEGTLHLLKYTKDGHAKCFVFASTSEIYGDPQVHPQHESYFGNVNPVGPRSCYDEGKRFGEALCMSFMRKYGADVRIARIFNTYGPNMERDDGRVISNFIVQTLQNKDMTIYGDGSQTRSFCFVADLVKGLHLMGTRANKGDIVNLGSDDEKKIVEIAHLIKKLTHASSRLIFEPLPQDDPKRRKPDISRARRRLSWKPEVDLQEGLLKTISYFKERFDL